jgi:competence CoiA-like predicted nuclease
LLTCKLGDQIINCYDGKHAKETLKKWSDKNILLCSVCGKPYEYCHGRVIDPYFRHKEKDQCEDIYSETESQEHISGKKTLYEWAQTLDGVYDVVLEGWIPETHQRPDIMFKHDGKQYVIEYQCTPIASEYLERHELYKAAGIIDFWILGWENYFKPYKEYFNQSKRIIETDKNPYFKSNISKLFVCNTISEFGTSVFNDRNIEYALKDVIIDFDENIIMLSNELTNPNHLEYTNFINTVSKIINNLNVSRFIRYNYIFNAHKKNCLVINFLHKDLDFGWSKQKYVHTFTLSRKYELFKMSEEEIYKLILDHINDTYRDKINKWFPIGCEIEMNRRNIHS